MNRALLFKFFEGETNKKEELAIRQWMETSEENKHTFYTERLTYDALILNPPKLIKKEKRPYHYVLCVFGSVAAVALVFILIGLCFFEPKSKNQQYCTMYVPSGQRIHMVLPDSTSVWLNGNTVLKYPSRFHTKNREVYLDGEAYFDVVSTKNTPFTVQTAYGKIFVTGTSFNIESYAHKDFFETSLFEGRLHVYLHESEYVSLQPNEKSTLVGDRLEVTDITDTDKYLWRRGLIAFHNKHLNEILHTLEKCYDVTIQVDTTHIPSHTYTGKFRQADGLDYALRVLQKSIHFTYERDDENNIIHIK